MHLNADLRHRKPSQVVLGVETTIFGFGLEDHENLWFEFGMVVDSHFVFFGVLIKYMNAQNVYWEQ